MPNYEFHKIYDTNMPLSCHIYTIKSFNNPSNWHENIEILYVTDGEGYIQYGNHTHEAKKGDIFVINSYVSHCGNTKSGTLKYFCFILDNEFCSFNGFNTSELSYQNKINDENVENILKKIIIEYQDNKTYKEGALKALTLELLLILTRNYSTPNSVSLKNIKNADNIKSVVGYIRSHFAESLTVEKLANQAGLSKYYFSREFKRLTGMTVITYVNYVKCENAKKLFLSKNYSINEISEMCGFDNLSYFSKTFKSFIGQTPSTYIKRL